MLKLFALVLLVTPTVASAHTFWLQPEHHQVKKGAEVPIAFQVGDAANVQPWKLYWERVVSLRSYGPEAGLDVQRTLRETSGDQPGGAVVTFEGEGTHILAFESNPSASDLEAAAFDRYVEEEGLHAVARARQAAGAQSERGTELYARRAKTLVQVGKRRTENVTRPLGHTLEIVPLQNPYALTGDRALTVQVLFRGVPLREGVLHVTRSSTPGSTQKFPIGDKGRVTLPVAAEGRWVLDLVWSVPAPHDDRADYVTHFASLSFGYE